MGLFGTFIKTAVNVVTLPVAVAADVIGTAQDVMEGNDINPVKHTADHVQMIKDEAE
jgi:hypothetical protein